MVTAVIVPEHPARHELLAFLGRDFRVPITHKSPPSSALSTAIGIVVVVVVVVFFVQIHVRASAAGAGRDALVGGGEHASQPGVGEELHDLLLCD